MGRASIDQLHALIESQCTRFDVRFTYALQITIEDVNGRPHRLPSDFTVSDVVAVLQSRLENTPATSDIVLGNYEISNYQNSKQIISKESPL